MGVCQSCGQRNKNYCNYCSNDGKDLSNFNSKLTFNDEPSGYCGSCGHKTSPSSNYCPGCGKLLSKIGIRGNETCGKSRISRGKGTGSEITGGRDDSSNGIIENLKEMFEDVPVFIKKAQHTLKNFDYINFVKDNIQTVLKSSILSIVLLTVFMSIVCKLWQSSFLSFILQNLLFDLVFVFLESHKFKVMVCPYPPLHVDFYGFVATIKYNVMI